MATRNSDQPQTDAATADKAVTSTTPQKPKVSVETTNGSPSTGSDATTEGKLSPPVQPG